MGASAPAGTLAGPAVPALLFAGDTGSVLGNTSSPPAHGADLNLGLPESFRHPHPNMVVLIFRPGGFCRVRAVFPAAAIRFLQMLLEGAQPVVFQ